MAQVKEHSPLPLAMNGGGEDEIDFRELFAALWRGKWWIVTSTFVGAVIAVMVAISLPNIYRSEALLAPSAEQQGGGLAAMAAQFGGLASLAGVNLSGGSGLDKTAIAVEIGKSRQFLSHFIRQHQLEVPLMAVAKADKATGELVIDEYVYDATSKKWVREVPPGKSVEPTDWELVKAFRDIASISQDAKSGLVTVAVEYYSPESTKQWVDWLVADLNEAMKLRDQTDATRNITYLKAQLEKTPVADMQKVFYQLIEDQTKTLMLTEVNQEYVFKTLDPAVVAEEKAKPKRALIAVLGTLLGGMLGVMLVLVRHAVGRPLRR
ncbi:Wzz/FepE/Etk N-terminal domain-containing protein [Aeromonas salmonicida]|uniref:Wzz/FepE/Etk N-terminal domain-containing protein n=1 Tax=Aeromonas salmonicida TaxID=645 RepID=UPI000C1C6708|nr:Wzz/FepE/Etk N-terminal domain-containing protein [Aeromonas salmonicida]ATU98470.1 lipopolysaccharide biosynthesis protein [Aeromonas salmonicida]HEG4446356.1 lipopolysaccharide biosynthesis protein [Aeromonas hydrophila]